VIKSFELILTKKSALGICKLTHVIILTALKTISNLSTNKNLNIVAPLSTIIALSPKLLDLLIEQPRVAFERLVKRNIG